jgi:hypothetical protein
MGRLLLVFQIAIFTCVSAGHQSHFTGMLEYVSPMAIVIRLADHRELQLKIADRKGWEKGREIGDFVELRMKSIHPVFDDAIHALLYAEAHKIKFLRKPSTNELEAANASPARLFSGNLLSLSASGGSTNQSSMLADAGSDALSDLRTQVRRYLEAMPNFVADEVTTRFEKEGTPPTWHRLDQIRTEIRFTKRRESRTNIFRDDEPWNAPYEALPGMKWGAAFAARVRAVFLSHADIAFAAQGAGILNGRAVRIYSFLAPPDSITRWYVGPELLWPSTQGRVWLAESDFCVLQLELKSVGLASQFPLSSVYEKIVFDYVNVGAAMEALPAQSEIIWRRQDGAEFTNQNIYRNYRHFETASQLLEPDLP